MSSNSDFQIKDGVLIRYTGKDKDVVIPDSVTKIEYRAFGKCNSLTSITIPNSVTSIGEGVFEDCESLTSIKILDLEAWLKIDFDEWGDTDFYGNRSQPSYNLYLGNEKVTKLIILNNVTRIGKLAFCGCKSLTSIKIPDSVTSIP